MVKNIDLDFCLESVFYSYWVFDENLYSLWESLGGEEMEKPCSTGVEHC